MEEGHYLRERAAPGGRAVAWESVRVRWVAGRGCWGGVGLGQLRLPGMGAAADKVWSEFHRIIRKFKCCQSPKI